MSPRFPSPVIDQMLTRGQITRVAPNRAQSDQLLTQAEALPLADNPARPSKPLRFELEGLHCARRGDYRVIYRIDPAGHCVQIVAIEHRSDAYRTR